MIHICPEEIALFVALKAAILGAWHWVRCGGCARCYRAVVARVRSLA